MRSNALHIPNKYNTLLVLSNIKTQRLINVKSPELNNLILTDINKSVPAKNRTFYLNIIFRFRFEYSCEVHTGTSSEEKINVGAVMVSDTADWLGA